MLHLDNSTLRWQKHKKFSFVEPDLNKNPIGDYILQWDLY